MAVATVRSPAEYEERLRTYPFERAEEVRAVRVGEKEVSERAATVDPIERNEEEKGISIRALAERLRVASDESAGAYGELRDRWFERLLGPERDPVPASYHMSYMRRLSPLEETYTKERSVEVCLETL